MSARQEPRGYVGLEIPAERTNRHESTKEQIPGRNRRNATWVAQPRGDVSSQHEQQLTSDEEWQDRPGTSRRADETPGCLGEDCHGDSDLRTEDERGDKDNHVQELDVGERIEGEIGADHQRCEHCNSCGVSMLHGWMDYPTRGI